MNDDKISQDASKRSETAMPNRSGQKAQEQQQQAAAPDASAPPAQRVLAGRKPLFRS